MHGVWKIKNRKRRNQPSDNVIQQALKFGTRSIIISVIDTFHSQKKIDLHKENINQVMKSFLFVCSFM